MLTRLGVPVAFWPGTKLSLFCQGECTGTISLNTYPIRSCLILKRRFLFAILFLLSIGLMAFSEGGPKARVIAIVAKRFTYVPDEITLKKGEPVILRVHAADVTHGLLIEQFNVKGDVPKNKDASYSFTPDRAGDFEGKCSHFCGPGHGSMKMIIHVTE